MNNKNKRAYAFMITINKDSECIKDYKDILKYELNSKYAYITHNKDKLEDGSPKREHVHIVIEYKNAHTWNSLHNKFIGANIKECISNTSKMVQYLIHKNDLSKFQYGVNEITSNDNDWLLKMLNNEQNKEYKEVSPSNIIADYKKDDKELLLTYGVKNFKDILPVIKELRFNDTEQLRNITINEQAQFRALKFEQEYNKLKDRIELLEKLIDKQLPF